ncbi:adenylate kinase family protein [Patescibacteria group bacterium]
MRILLIGPPASGKGTVGRLLGNYLNIPVLSVGKYLRSVPKEHEHYEMINDVMRKGELVPNHILGKMLDEEIQDSRYENGVIIEGWLRQISDLDYFDPKPDYALLLNVSKETSKYRILNRRVCKEQGHTYNLTFNPPKEDGLCDIDGSELTIREDDNEEILEKRWKIHEETTIKTIDHFRKLGKLIDVSTEETPDKIFEDIKKKLSI